MWMMRIEAMQQLSCLDKWRHVHAKLENISRIHFFLPVFRL